MSCAQVAGGNAADESPLGRYKSHYRAERRAKLQLRLGADRSICPECVALAQARLKAIGVRFNFPGLHELFWTLQRVLHTTDVGAHLPLHEFSSPNTGAKILSGLSETGLIYCVDPDSWKPTDYNFKNAEARRYLPSSNLLLANAGLNVVASAGDYLEGRFASRKLATSSSVEVDNSSGVTIPSLVISKLEAGTGFGFDLRLAIPRLDELPEEKKIHVLRSGQQALTCLGHPGPLHAQWNQKQSGRLYARKPALLSLPKHLRVGLLAPDEKHVASVDLGQQALNSESYVARRA